jgi:cytochrome c biogenesis factor
MLNSSDNIIILIVLVLILNKNKLFLIYKPLCIITILFTYKNYQYNQFIFINYHQGVNFNLINGVMLIHPIILYIVYILFLIKIFFILNFSKKFFLKNNGAAICWDYTLVYIMSALFLGSYWAEQELFWGGW